MMLFKDIVIAIIKVKLPLFDRLLLWPSPKRSCHFFIATAIMASNKCKKSEIFSYDLTFSHSNTILPFKFN